jgi:hypothetical protein
VLDVVGAGVLVRAGLIKPVRPDRLVFMALALVRWGITPGHRATRPGAARTPDRPALVDDDGVLTFREVDRAPTGSRRAAPAGGAGRRRRRACSRATAAASSRASSRWPSAGLDVLT